MTSLYPLTLLYDGACPVCALEMDALRTRDREGRLAFVDITAPSFDPTAHGLHLAALDGALHGIAADGTVLRGMETIRAAYGAVGLGWFWAPTATRPLRGLFDRGYRVFARNRHGVSRALAPWIEAVRVRRARRALQAMARCHDGACSLPRATPRARS